MEDDMRSPLASGYNSSEDSSGDEPYPGRFKNHAEVSRRALEVETYYGGIRNDEFDSFKTSLQTRKRLQSKYKRASDVPERVRVYKDTFTGGSGVVPESRRDRNAIHKKTPWLDYGTSAEDIEYFRVHMQPKLHYTAQEREDAWKDDTRELYQGLDPGDKYVRFLPDSISMDEQPVYERVYMTSKHDTGLPAVANDSRYNQWVHDRCVRGPRMAAALRGETTPLPVRRKVCALADRFIERHPEDADTSDSTHSGYEEDAEDPEGFDAFRVEYRKANPDWRSRKGE